MIRDFEEVPPAGNQLSGLQLTTVGDNQFSWPTWRLVTSPSICILLRDKYAHTKSAPQKLQLIYQKTKMKEKLYHIVVNIGAIF